MATATLVTASEYLRTRYEPDAEFVDGHIEERQMGERTHNALQKRLLLLLSTLECQPFFESVQEQRMRVSATRMRIPDICLISATSPWEEVVLTAPLLCIEVLSPEDTMSRTLVRVRDFLTMGVPEVWIVDPALRTIHVCAGDTLTQHSEGSLTVPATPISVQLAEVFRVLDPK